MQLVGNKLVCIGSIRSFVLHVQLVGNKLVCVGNGGTILIGYNRSTRNKPYAAPLCPPQISHGLTWDRTGVSAETGF